MLTRGPHPVAFAIRGPITRDDLPGLCDRVCALLRAHGPGDVRWDVGDVRADAVAIDALARLQLAARRLGCRVYLCDADEELVALVTFMGLTDVLPCDEFRRARPSHPTRATTNGKERRVARMIFPNIPVKDLDRSVAFFTELGFTFDERFTDETATAMVVNEQASVMLLLESRFKDFTNKELVDATQATETILAVSADSREDVDDLADRALAAGGSAANEPMDLGFMYARSFSDPDGHLWEVVWMDPAALEQGAEATATAH